MLLIKIFINHIIVITVQLATHVLDFRRLSFTWMGLAEWQPCKDQTRQLQKVCIQTLPHRSQRRFNILALDIDSCIAIMPTDEKGRAAVGR